MTVLQGIIKRFENGTVPAEKERLLDWLTDCLISEEQQIIDAFNSGEDFGFFILGKGKETHSLKTYIQSIKQ